MKSIIKLILKASLVVSLSLALPLQTVGALPLPANDQFIQASDSNEEVKDSTKMPRLSNSRSLQASDKTRISLNRINHYSKTIYNLVKINNWKDAKSNLGLLEAAARSLKTEMGIANINLAKLDSTITALQSTIAAKSHQSMGDANEVTKLAAQLTAQLEPKIPLEVAMLDYYGRELEIWGKTENIPRLKEVAGKIGQTWQNLRPSVQLHGGSAQLQQFDDALVALVQTASSPNEYSLVAAPMLGEVDNLRKVFK